jgi:hypothetical protein
MKKEIFYYSILLVVIAGLLISETIDFTNQSKTASKVIEFDNFEKLDIDLACTFFVTVGDEQKVVFEGPQEYLDLIESELEDGVLKISCRQSGFFAQLFGKEIDEENEIKVYINITSSDQLVLPKKGNLISRETSFYPECENSVSFGQSVKNILQSIGTHLSYIKLV